MAYASAADMVVRYDVRTLGDLLTDDGLRQTPAQVAASATLASLLSDASGEIDAALRVGQRYTAANLAALTGNSLALLKRITCQIAMRMIWERRPYLNEMQEVAREDSQDKSRRMLEKLRKGEAIFDIADVPDAGLPSHDQPQLASIERLNLTVDHARRGYFPARRLPTE